MPSLIRWMPIDTLPLAFSFFHQCSSPLQHGSTYRLVNGIWFLWPWLGSGLGSTSGWSGWDFRPGSSGMGGMVLRALSGGSCGESLGMAVKGLGASSHSSAMPSARKRVRPWGNVGSSPRSPSTSNLTCFLSSPQPVLRYHLTMPCSWIHGVFFVC